MTFIFKNLKFKSSTIKKLVTSHINANKGGNQEGDNDNYRLIISDKKKVSRNKCNEQVFECDFKSHCSANYLVHPLCFY